MRFFEDHDEFYWNVTGNDWPVPIDRASAQISFPESAAGSLRAQAFTGVYGSAERGATSEVRGSEVSFETNNPLPMRGGMTIDVFIPKGILKEPSGFTRLLWFLGSNPIVFLPFWTFGVMLTNVFLGGEVTRLSSLKNRFYMAIPPIRQGIMSRLRTKGMYLLDPDS